MGKWGRLGPKLFLFDYKVKNRGNFTVMLLGGSLAIFFFQKNSFLNFTGHSNPGSALLRNSVRIIHALFKKEVIFELV